MNSFGSNENDLYYLKYLKAQMIADDDLTMNKNESKQTKQSWNEIISELIDS